jgi:hypothetical protein
MKLNDMPFTQIILALEFFCLQCLTFLSVQIELVRCQLLVIMSMEVCI